MNLLKETRNNVRQTVEGKVDGRKMCDAFLNFKVLKVVNNKWNKKKIKKIEAVGVLSVTGLFKIRTQSDADQSV